MKDDSRRSSQSEASLILIVTQSTSLFLVVALVAVVDDEVKVSGLDFLPDRPDLFRINSAPVRDPPESLKRRTILKRRPG